MRVTKDFHFHAAHRIPEHRSRCAWLHGHTYRLEITVESDRLDALDMVIDFDDLSSIVREAVVDRWDHSTLLRRDDPLVPGIAAAQSRAPERLVLFDANPTAEVLAREAFDSIAKRLPESVSLRSVAVWETATSSARHGRGDDG